MIFHQLDGDNHTHHTHLIVHFLPLQFTCADTICVVLLYVVACLDFARLQFVLSYPLT